MKTAADWMKKISASMSKDEVVEFAEYLDSNDGHDFALEAAKAAAAIAPHLYANTSDKKVAFKR